MELVWAQQYDLLKLKKENEVLKMSYWFVLRVVKFCRWLMGERREFVLTNQLMNSGPLVGANVEEALKGSRGEIFFLRSRLFIRRLG